MQLLISGLVVLYVLEDRCWDMIWFAALGRDSRQSAMCQSVICVVACVIQPPTVVAVTAFSIAVCAFVEML